MNWAMKALKTEMDLSDDSKDQLSSLIILGQGEITPETSSSVVQAGIDSHLRLSSSCFSGVFNSHSLFHYSSHCCPKDQNLANKLLNISPICASLY